MRVLVVDDDRSSRRILRHQLESRGHDVVEAGDGETAWNLFCRDSFSMVITDWMMPSLSGVELVKRIRRTPTTHYTYTIVLTARAEREDLLAGMDAGADDFLTKPLDSRLLQVRLKAGERIIRLEQDLADRNDALANSNERLHRDLRAVAQFQQSLLPQDLPNSEQVRFAFTYEPCEELAGDILNVFPLDDRHIGFYLLDVSGHGAQAALLSFTLHRLLTPHPVPDSVLKKPRRDQQGFTIVSPLDVAEHLNQRFPINLETGQYFTIVYAVLETHTGRLRYVTAGHPPLLYNRQDGTVEMLRSPAAPIGFVEEPNYKEHTLQLLPGERIYIYSDGISEAMNREEDQFGEEQLGFCIARANHLALQESLDHLLYRVDQWSCNAPYRDDVSLLALEWKPLPTHQRARMHRCACGNAF